MWSTLSTVISGRFSAENNPAQHLEQMLHRAKQLGRACWQIADDAYTLGRNKDASDEVRRGLADDILGYPIDLGEDC